MSVLINNVKEKLNIYAHDTATVRSACQYYRISTPFRALHKIDEADIFIDHGEIDRSMVVPAMFMSDIIHYWGIAGEHWFDIFNTVKNMKPKPDASGKMMYPPTIIYDIDDNLEYTHPFNHAFGHLGVRNIDGTKLEPGDSVWTELADGTEVPLWVDKETLTDKGKLFDIERNWQTVGSANGIAKIVDAVTVPSQALANYYRTVHGVKRVYVYPNSVMISDYHFPNLAPRTDGSIRILWQGGDSHLPDWYPLKDALSEICRKYPQVTFVMFGTMYDWVYDAIPQNQLEYHDWVPYEAYKLKRHILDIDINLCPLARSIFNKCKSAIKWYEASIGPRPEATLASNYGPYTEIEDGKTGLLYNTPEEFVQKLSALIENAELRKDIATNAKEWVKANRYAEVTAVKHAEIFRELRSIKKAELLEA